MHSLRNHIFQIEENCLPCDACVFHNAYAFSGHIKIKAYVSTSRRTHFMTFAKLRYAWGKSRPPRSDARLNAHLGMPLKIVWKRAVEMAQIIVQRGLGIKLELRFCEDGSWTCISLGHWHLSPALKIRWDGLWGFNLLASKRRKG